MPCGTSHFSTPLRYAWAPGCSGVNSSVLTVPQLTADSEETTGRLPLAGSNRCSGHATPWMVKLW